MRSIASVMSGVIHARMRSTCTKLWYSSPEAALNFCFSCSSRTKDFTTRIPETFSSTESFRRSYFLKMRLKMGMTVREILNTAKPRRTETTTNTAAMGPPVTNAITMENAIMSGARTTRRSSIMYACWTLLTSVVSLVTSELVLKWSMLLNEKRWICANTS